MKLSARNQIKGTIKAVKPGATTTHVTIEVSPDVTITASITNEAAAELGLNVLCVNTLTPAQEGLSPVFAGMTQHTMNERFDGYAWQRLATGAPVLDQAVVVFDCKIDQVVEVGTHDVFFCSVEAVRTGSAHEGLIYYGRGYHRVAIG